MVLYNYIYDIDKNIVDFGLTVRTYMNLKFVALFCITKSCQVWFNDIQVFRYSNKIISLNELISKLCTVVDN